MKIMLTNNNLPRRRQQATSLAEVMVGISLMGILFVSLYSGMSSGFAVTQVSRENLRATQIMMERMEGVRLYNWNQLVYSNWIPATFTNWYYPITNRGESPGIMYIGRMVVTDAVLNPSPAYTQNLRSVVVTVDWVSGNVPRSRSMTTTVARYGVQNYVYGSVGN
jgi:type II secretory pathway pseudopilin PulG